MIDNDIRILTFDELSTGELYDALYLRAKVFVEEQECPYLDLDYVDQQCLHCMLYEKGELMAYARVIPPGIQHGAVGIGRVVTARPRKGYGSRIFSAAMRAATDIFNANRIEISSQSYIQHFYERFGFRTVSEEFILEFRPHVSMVWDKETPYENFN